MEYVSSKEQLVDFLTKAIPSASLQAFMSKMNVKNIYLPLEGEYWKNNKTTGINSVKRKRSECKEENKFGLKVRKNQSYGPS